MTGSKAVFVGFALVLIGFASYVHVAQGDVFDKGFLLQIAREWVDGKRLYLDQFDVNLPLIYVLYGLAIHISLLVPVLSAGNVLSLLGLCFVGASIFLSKSLIKYHPQFEKGANQWAFAAALAFVFIYYPTSSFFFDREHIMVVCTFPYVLRFSPTLSSRVLPRWLRVSIAVLAVFGFCIKPYSAVLFVGVQLAYVINSRSFAILFSLENVIIAGAGAAYLAGVIAWVPEFAFKIIPMALATYSAFKTTGIISLLFAFLLFGVTFADFRWRLVSPLRREIFYFLCISAAYLAYPLLQNGWGYTYYPLMAIGLFLTVWVWWEQRYFIHHHVEAEPREKRSFVFGARACMVNLMFYFFYATAGLFAFLHMPACRTVVSCGQSFPTHIPIMQALEGHKSFGLVSSDYGLWVKIARATGAHNRTRFWQLWMLKKFTIADEQFARENQWILDYVDTAYAEDLERNKPDVIFVESNGVWELSKIFAHSARLEQAWGQYRRDHIIDMCDSGPEKKKVAMGCNYVVYVRADTSVKTRQSQ